jgi:glycosyltransferase involved in cell wall biosynthesis
MGGSRISEVNKTQIDKAMKTLVFDVQTLQGGSRFRGIGRATTEIIRSIATQVNSDTRVFALFNASRDFPLEIRKEFEERNIEFVGFYPYENEEESDIDCLEISEKVKTMVVKALNADLYIGPHIFEGFERPVYSKAISGVKSASFVYDAIPLRYPEQYLKTDALLDWYSSRLEIIKGYDVIFGLTKASILEASKLMNLDSARVRYIGGGFHQKSNFQRKDETSKEVFNFLYFGALDSRKNVQLLIRSFADLSNSTNLNARLLIAGHVQDYDHEILPLENLAKKLNILDKIDFKGYIQDSEIERLFCAADVYVQTSLAEGLGLGLLDAVAHGVPAIACSIPSAREILGEDRYLFQNETESLSKLMFELVSDRELRIDFAASQFRHAQNLNWEKAATEILIALPESWNRNVESPAFNARENYLKLSVEIQQLSSIDRLDQEQISRVISINYARLIQRFPDLNPGIYSVPNKLLIEGHFEGSYSLSILNREFADALGEQSLEVVKQEIYFETEKNRFKAKGQVDSTQNSNDYIVSRNVYPPIAHDMRGQWNFYHCFNWEETEFPSKYVMEFNYFLDGVTCASAEVQKALIDSGVRVPTQVVPLARSIDKNSGVQGSTNNHEMIFLHVSSGFPRKGVDVLVKAFEEEFKNTHNAMLIIKTFLNPHQNVKELVSKIESPGVQNRIRIIEEEYSDEQMQDLYNFSDCLVQPSRGEGFGLPILEATTLGLKVIATRWGGHMDFYNDSEKYGINYQMQQSRSHVSTGKSLWAEPDFNHLKAQMRKVYSQGKYLKKSEPSLHNWSLSAQKHLDFMTRVMSKRKTPPKIAWLSSWDTKCGIAEYSSDLLLNFDTKYTKVFAPYEESSLGRNNEIDYVRCWSPGLGNSLHLVNELNTYQPSIVIIQFNLGFFSVNQMKELLNKTQHIKRIIEIHSLRTGAEVPHKNIIELLPAFAKVDRILVHNLEDLNFLHEHGLINQAVLFPHPIPNFGHRVSHHIDASDKVVIGTSGFSLPHKGHVELIEAVKQLSKDRKSVV